MAPEQSPRLVTIVVPVYNEEGNIPHFAERVREHAANIPERLEFLFIDDGSTDRTWERLTALAAADPGVRCLALSRNFGKENALAAGLDAARGDAVIVMDGDLQHPPEIIPRMLAIWRAGEADVVDAIKRDRGRESKTYQLMSTWFYALARRLSGLEIDRSSDFKLLDARVVAQWRRFTETHLFFRGMSSWLGFKHASIHFDVAERTHGRASWPFWRLVKLALTGITSFSSIPLHVVTLIGGAFLAGGFLLGARTLAVRLSGHPPDGFTQIMLILLILGGTIMISLGIIGEYIARIFDEVKRRPRYVVTREIGRGGAADKDGGDL